MGGSPMYGQDEGGTPGTGGAAPTPMYQNWKQNPMKGGMYDQPVNTLPPQAPVMNPPGMNIPQPRPMQNYQLNAAHGMPDQRRARLRQMVMGR